MSISLPNGTLLAAPSSSQVQLTAAVTRILHLANFSPELKTRDLQLMFKEWDADKGGYRIKWLDDVNALVVFADAGVAKRAYLSFLLHPPPQFQGQIRPYDRPDAAQIIQSLAARALGHRSSLSTANGLASGGPGSLSFPFPANNDPAAPQVHSRAMSVTNAHKPNGSISGIPLLPNGSGSISGPGSNSGPGGPGPGPGPAGISRPQRIGHNRTGSASSSWARQSLSGSLGALGSQSFGAAGGGGALSFGGGALAPRLPTHSEGSASVPASRSASSSSGGDPVIVVDPSASKGWKGAGPGFGGGAGGGAASGAGAGAGAGEGATRGPRGEGAGARRESVSAEKALREVQKALASVEAQG